MDPRINETLQTGAVGNRTYRVGENVYLFLEFTIVFGSLPVCATYRDLEIPPTEALW